MQPVQKSNVELQCAYAQWLEGLFAVPEGLTVHGGEMRHLYGQMLRT